MKNKDILRAINDIDWDMVEDARATDGIKVDGVKPTDKRKKIPKGFWTKGALAAACLCLAVITVFTVLPRLNSITPPTPGGDGTPGGDETHGESNYINITLSDNKVKLSNPKNYKELFDTMYAIKSLEMDKENYQIPEGDIQGDKGDAAGDRSAQQIVDNQTEGVEEGDIIKRTDTHIFYLHKDHLRVYLINGEEIIDINYISFKEWSYTMRGEEIYISADGKTLFIIVTFGSRQVDTAVLSFDISDPNCISHINIVKISGVYNDSRMVNGQLLVFTNYCTKDNCAESNLSTYVPYVDNNGKREYTSEDKIYVPDGADTALYTVITRINERGTEILENVAIMSFSGHAIYLSSDNIYIIRSVQDKVESAPVRLERSEILCVSFSKEMLEVQGCIKVNGKINNRYFLDEYNGILRVVVSSVYEIEKTTGKKGNTVYKRSESADLYCFDVETFEKRAEVIAFAPKGETVQSVRYDGDCAYVCTAIRRQDPVFFFDLSDLDNITYAHTDEIPGYSTSLIQFPGETLVGIGVDGDGTFKLEAYREEGDKVVSVDEFKYKPTTVDHVYEKAGFSLSDYNYKSYFIDRENGYIGLTGVLISLYKDNIYFKSVYLLLKFDGEKIVQVAEVDMLQETSDVRGFVADGYLYTVSREKVKAIKLS